MDGLRDLRRPDWQQGLLRYHCHFNCRLGQNRHLRWRRSDWEELGIAVCVKIDHMRCKCVLGHILFACVAMQGQE